MVPAKGKRIWNRKVNVADLMCCISGIPIAFTRGWDIKQEYYLAKVMVNYATGGRASDRPQHGSGHIICYFRRAA